MRLLTRYVLREFLFPLTYCLTGFIAIYVLFEMFGSLSRLLESNMPLEEIVDYFLGYLSPYFMWLAPAALMLATLYTMWNFCRHSEIVAMRASGVSFIAIVKPLIFVAFVMAGIVAWVNECYVPRHAQWAKQVRTAKFDLLKVDRADALVYRNARANRVWTIESQANAKGTELLNVIVTTDHPSGARAQTIIAPRARYLAGEWWFDKPVIQHFDINGTECASPTPEADALEFRVFPDFRERPDDILIQNRDWQYTSVRGKLRFIRTHKDITKEHRRACLYDAWAQAVAPFACFVITLFAIPAGIASGRQSVFKGILSAIALFFAFYALTLSCMALVEKGWLSPIPAALLPDVLFLGLGIRNFYKQR